MDRFLQHTAYGPVPSRRLGLSIGVNNIPPKHCSYSCVYCQIGRTRVQSSERLAFYDPELVYTAVASKIAYLRQHNEPFDYITFVADGEPTLERYLTREIELVSNLGPVAVITNASLLWDEEVQQALMKAAWVSVKVDSASESVWRALNRPAIKLSFDKVQQSKIDFARDYKGKLVTETMLVSGVNDGEDIQSTAEFVAALVPTTAYLAIPTRPPAEPWVEFPAEDNLNRAYQVFSEFLPNVEYLTGFEGSGFTSTGDIEADLLGITAVHPMREDSVEQLLEKTGTDWSRVYHMMARGLLVCVSYNGHSFYLRKHRQTC